MFSCDICTDTFYAAELSVLPCGHAFHNTCLERSLKINHTCPRCRANVQKNKVIKKIYVDVAEGVPGEDVNNTILSLQNEINGLDRAAITSRRINEQLRMEKLKAEHEVKSMGSTIRRLQETVHMTETLKMDVVRQRQELEAETIRCRRDVQNKNAMILDLRTTITNTNEANSRQVACLTTEKTDLQNCLNTCRAANKLLQQTVRKLRRRLSRRGTSQEESEDEGSKSESEDIVHIVSDDEDEEQEDQEQEQGPASTNSLKRTHSDDYSEESPAKIQAIDVASPAEVVTLDNSTDPSVGFSPVSITAQMISPDEPSTSSSCHDIIPPDLVSFINENSSPYPTSFGQNQDPFSPPYFQSMPFDCYPQAFFNFNNGFPYPAQNSQGNFYPQ